MTPSQEPICPTCGRSLKYAEPLDSWYDTTPERYCEYCLKYRVPMMGIPYIPERREVESNDAAPSLRHPHPRPNDAPT